ncbi:MAG TPA: hypothetical protein VIX15_00175 [Streptosporangiaceae bacterium]
MISTTGSVPPSPKPPQLIPPSPLVGARRGKARTRTRAGRLLGAAGFTCLAWHDVYAIIKAVTAAT